MKKKNTMTSSELKALYQALNPNGHFFDRKTMKYFGDTMKNYGVTKLKLMDKAANSKPFDGYILYRKKPVKNGLQDPAYFTTEGKQVHNVKAL